MWRIAGLSHPRDIAWKCYIGRWLLRGVARDIFIGVENQQGPCTRLTPINLNSQFLADLAVHTSIKAYLICGLLKKFL